jgi:hypothetical protein
VLGLAQGEHIMRIGIESDVKTGLERSVNLLWVVGNCLWCSIDLILFWHGHDAQTFAGSLTHPRWLLSLFTPGPAGSAAQAVPLVLLVSGLGICWSLAGQAWLAKLRKTRTV